MYIFNQETPIHPVLPQGHKQFGPGHAKICHMPYANNNGADQPAHPCSLISTFVVRCLDSMICILLYPKFQDSS